MQGEADQSGLVEWIAETSLKRCMPDLAR